MALNRTSLLRWVTTLKFKIVAIAVVTGVVSAMGTTDRKSTRLNSSHG